MPAKSEKQRRFMGAELARKREGKPTKTTLSEEELEDFASKSAVQKLWAGARQEGVKPDIPRTKNYKQQTGSNKDADAMQERPKRVDFQKQETFLKFQVDYKMASHEQFNKGEKCDTCFHWKDGGACHIVLGYIAPNMWCNKWEPSAILQDDTPIQKLQASLIKEGEGGEGGIAGGGTVFTSTNAGIFNPTHGDTQRVKTKKKSGIERLGLFVTENSPEKKMMKSSINALTNLIHEVRLELRKYDVKRQTPYNSRPTEEDPPQMVERGKDDPNSKGLPEDPNLVAGQKMTEKEQKRIINEEKNMTVAKDYADGGWGSGPTEADSLRRSGKQDKLKEHEDRNEPEEPKLTEKERLFKLIDELEDDDTLS